MTTLLPRDDDQNPIPALRLKPNGAQALAVTATSIRINPGFATTTRVISVVATGPVFIRTGDATVTASGSDHYLPAGVYTFLSLGRDPADRHSHLAAIRADTNCTLYLSERE